MLVKILQIGPDAVGHSGIFGLLHLTIYVLGHAESLSGMLK